MNTLIAGDKEAEFSKFYSLNFVACFILALEGLRYIAMFLLPFLHRKTILVSFCWLLRVR